MNCISSSQLFAHLSYAKTSVINSVSASSIGVAIFGQTLPVCQTALHLVIKFANKRGLRKSMSYKKEINSIIKFVLPVTLHKILLNIYFKTKFRSHLLPNRIVYQSTLNELSGIEVGGPSFFFRAVLPVYFNIRSLDCVNYAMNTKWEGSVKEGRTFQYLGRNLGRQYIAEATDLSEIPSDKYDFLLSSNCLEHTANPLKAMSEWVRIVKPGGYVLLVLPKKEDTFDNKRPTSTFSHLLDDFKNETGEDDETCLNEVLSMHDLSKDLNAGGYEKFKQTCLQNITNREMHHHVFDIPLMHKVFEYFNIKVLQSDSCHANNIVFGQVSITRTPIRNSNE